MSLQTGIQALATRIGNYLRDEVLPRLLPTGGSVGQVATRTGGGYAWQTPSGGAASIQSAVINVPYVSMRDHESVIAAAGVTPATKLSMWLAAMPDTAENDSEETADWHVQAVPEADQIRVILRAPGRLGGPVTVNYLLGA